MSKIEGAFFALTILIMIAGAILSIQEKRSSLETTYITSSGKEYSGSDGMDLADDYYIEDSEGNLGCGIDEAGALGRCGWSGTIHGNYSTLADLQAAFPDGKDFDGTFLVGNEYYIWDNENKKWISTEEYCKTTLYE